MKKLFSFLLPVIVVALIICAYIIYNNYFREYDLVSVDSSTCTASIINLADEGYDTVEKMQTSLNHFKDDPSSNVLVYTELTNDKYIFFEDNVSTMQGSGVIFKKDDKDYYVLTNYHVTNKSTECDNVKYYIYDTYLRKYEAELIVEDINYDLAVLKFKSRLDYTIPVLDYENIMADEVVVSLGNPSGKQNTLSYGFSYKYSTGTFDWCNVTFPCLYHTAKTEGGSSGCGIYDLDNELIGIHFATSYNDANGNGNKDDNETAYGIAIPILSVRAFLSSHNITSY